VQLCCPVDAWKFPAVHKVQALVPVEAVLRPVWQLVQEFPSPSEYMPAAQFSHAEMLIR